MVCYDRAIMTTMEHPITRSELREELQHYATKADLADLKAELTRDIGELETRLVKWIVGVQIGGLAALAAIATAIIAVMKFLGG